MDEKKIKVLITLGGIIFSIIVIALLFSFNKKDGVDYDSSNKEYKKEKLDIYDKYKGIIVKIDSTKKKITVRDYDNVEEIEFVYTEGCYVKNKYGKDIYYDKLKIGDVVVIGYDGSYDKLKYISIDGTVLQYKELKKYVLDDETYYISLDDKKYRLKKETFVYSNNKETTIYDLDENDIITLNIKGKDIISVVVEKSHGYVELSNYDSFLGYSLVVNDDISYEIKENLKISVPEGKNTFTIKNDKLTGSITEYISPHYNKVIDIKEIKYEEKKEGKVKFYIEPKNARLYINGKSYYYDEEIVLDYGTYKYTVESIGYNSYAGLMNVNADKKTISVYLKEKTSTEEPKKNDRDDKDDTEEDDETATPEVSATVQLNR